jgi:YVTN family beta-propeller protein
VGSTHRTARPPGRPVALVTAETENRLLAVSLPGGRVLRRVRVARDPTTVTAGATGPAIVVSPGSGAVTVLRPRSLRPLAVIHGFWSPQIAAITPDGEWALVTDAAGSVSVLDLATGRVANRVFVGHGAHHLAVSPDQRTAWVALGESAHRIVVVDCAHLPGLRVIARIHPPVAAHDLAFAPDGRTVWVTSAAAAHVTVFSARTRRVVATVPAGKAPQHVVFGGGAAPEAYVTSGYGASMEMVDPRDRRIVRTAALPYGSFNLAVSGRIVVTTSLMQGRVTELDARTLHTIMSAAVAPEARALALVRR